MGLSPHQAAPADADMPPSRPLANPVSMHTAQSPAMPAAPTVRGASLYAHNVFSEHGQGQQESGIRSSSQQGAQQPVRPSRGQALTNQSLPGSQLQHPLPGSQLQSWPAGRQSMASNGREDPLQAAQPHSACATGMAGSSMYSRPPSYSVTTDSLGLMPSQPPLNPPDSMATAVMHALIGSSKPLVSGHSYSTKVGHNQIPSLPVSHISSTPLGPDAAGSVHHPTLVHPPVHNVTRGSLPLHAQVNSPVPTASGGVNFSSVQQGMIQNPAQPIDMRQKNGIAGLGLTPAIQAAKRQGPASGQVHLSQAGVGRPPNLDTCGATQSSSQLLRMPGVSGTTLPTSPTLGHELFRVADVRAAAIHTPADGPAQQASPGQTPVPSTAQFMPISWAGQMQWPELPGQGSAVREHAGVQIAADGNQPEHCGAVRSDPGAASRHSPLHTRALSKPLPSQQRSSHDVAQPATMRAVKIGQGHAVSPIDSQPQLPQPTRSTSLAAHSDRAQPFQSIERPFQAQNSFSSFRQVEESKMVSMNGSLTAHAAEQPAAEPTHPMDVAVPTYASQLPAAIQHRTACHSHTSSAPRVNAPQRLPGLANPSVPTPASQPTSAIVNVRPPVPTVGAANTMHQRLAPTSGDSAVLARASEPQDWPTSSSRHMPPRRSMLSAAPAGAKSVRPALSFGGARKQANSAPKEELRRAPAKGVGPSVSATVPPSTAKCRPSVLTRKVLAQAGQRQKAPRTTSGAAASEPPSSSRTESVPRDEADEAADTALSSSTATGSLHSPPPQSSRRRGGVTLKHLIDAGLLSAGSQVLKVPLNGCVRAAGLLRDGSIECNGSTVPSLASLFNKHKCGHVSEEKAWRLVEYDCWSLRHYQRLYCMDVGALCPSGSLADSPRSVALAHPFALADEDMMMPVSPAAEARCEPPRRSTSISSVPAVSSCATAPAQPLIGVKRTRRQEAVLQATEAEELAEALIKPAKLFASLPLNCLFERGIVRYGASPSVAAAAAPMVKTTGAKSTAATIAPLTKPFGAKATKLVVKAVAKPAPKAAAKAAAAAADDADADFMLPTAAPAVVAPATAPLLQSMDKMQRLPPMPRKVKTLAATMPRAPTAAPSSTAICPVDSQQRSRRDVRAPPRHNGVSGLDHTMMQLESYSKPPGEKGVDAQPFAIDVHPEAVAAMDIHAHMCQNEVIGVLGGTYHAGAGRLQVLRAIAVQEGPLDVGHTDVEMDAADQSRAIEELRQDGLQCVGWYHSHPTFAVWPSAIDVYNQHTQQVARSHEAAMAGNAAPYIAAIVGPYDQKNVSAQSSMSWFYVENKRSSEFSLGMEPELCLQHMVPKLLATNLVADAELHAEQVMEVAASLVRKYATYEARIEFREFWRPDMTNLQKLISSLFHCVRAYLEAEELKDVGNRIVTEVLHHFYGMKSKGKGAGSRQTGVTKAGRSTKKA